MKSTIRFLLVLCRTRKFIVATTVVAAIGAGSFHFHLQDVDFSFLF
jgi:hypothetical protein